MSKDFRFFDSRQKYLLFVTTTNEKNIIAEKISTQIKNIKPKKPALKIFDAGLGDGTLLMSVLRNCHRKFPTIPFLVFGKEISMEDVRMSIEKLPDRFMEHPNMVFVVSNLYYAEAASLTSNNANKQKHINWETLKLYGIDAHARREARGVYVGDDKIASIGLRVSKGCSYHGFALNVNMDLTPFDAINPCGYKGLKMTQVKALAPNISFAQAQQDCLNQLTTQINAQHKKTQTKENETSS